MELQAWLRLSAAPGVGSLAACKLLRAFGSPEAIFDAPLAQLKQVVAANAAHALLESAPRAEELLGATLRWLDGAGGSAGEGTNSPASWRAVLSMSDPLYPKALLALEDPPLLLHVMARPGFWSEAQPLLDASPSAIAVVGSRNASTQGAIHAKGFAKGLAAAGWTVVSGLALGIDAAAHEGALEHVEELGNSSQSTVAVIGTGIDRIYPKANAALARRIAQQGAIVSEFVIGTPALAHNFPRRNRIIAALSRGTLVVEAAPQSGSLITARLAMELGKEVFAIPGSIHSTHSKGCHALIKQGAALVESVHDILDTPGFGKRRDAFSANAIATNNAATNRDNTMENGQNRSKMTDFEPSSAAAPSHLPSWFENMGHDPIQLDELLNRSGESAAMLQAQLLELELLGRVQRLPGNLYQQIGFA